MRIEPRDVTKMTVDEMRRERLIRLAWIRDVTGVNNARLVKLEEEMDRRKAEDKAA